MSEKEKIIYDLIEHNTISTICDINDETGIKINAIRSIIRKLKLIKPDLYQISITPKDGNMPGAPRIGYYVSKDKKISENGRHIPIYTYIFKNPDCTSQDIHSDLGINLNSTRIALSKMITSFANLERRYVKINNNLSVYKYRIIAEKSNQKVVAEKSNQED